MSTKAIETTDNEERFALLSKGPESIKGFIHEIMGTEKMGIADLGKIKMPPAGGLSFDVPDLKGDVAVKEIDGIILHSQVTRSYWRDEFSGGGSPPDCQSHDSIAGKGDPGGECMSCPMAEWGSDPKGGAGQACQQKREIFLLTKYSAFPFVLNAPATSLKPIKSYIVKLGGQNMLPRHVVSRFTLEPDKNKAGISFSKIKVNFHDDLTEEQKVGADSYAKNINPNIDIDIAEEAPAA